MVINNDDNNDYDEDDDNNNSNNNKNFTQYSRALRYHFHAPAVAISVPWLLESFIQFC